MMYETTPLEQPFDRSLGIRLLVVAGDKAQAVFWTRELGLTENQWTYVSSPASVRDRAARVLYCGTWSDQAAALEIHEALAYISGDRHDCGDKWEVEQEWYLYELRLNAERVRRDLAAAQLALSEARLEFYRQREERASYTMHEKVYPAFMGTTIAQVHP